MPSHEGKSNQPFVISREELAKFTILPAAEVAKLRAAGQEAKKPKESGRGDYLTLDQAETIMGKENFFGPNEVEKAFGIKIDTKNTPEIPFTEADLERARELGQFLVLRADKAEDGQPLTSEKMLASWDARSNPVADGKLFVNNSGYANDPFYKNETSVMGWALVSSDPIPDSTGKNYLDQTKQVNEYVTKVFEGQEMPAEYSEASIELQNYIIREFTGKTSAEIQSLLSGNATWKKYAQELSELKINQLTRQSFADVVYDFQMRYLNSDPARRVRLLENKYTWTNRRASGGNLVGVGGFDADGARVNVWKPGYSDSNLGVSFSRSR